LRQLLESIAQNNPLKPFAQAIGEAKAAALPAFHALTNADRLIQVAWLARENLGLYAGRHSKMQTTASSQLLQIFLFSSMPH